MPELPEVESVRRWLNDQVLGAKVFSVEAPAPVVIRSPDFETMREKLHGAEIRSVSRRGKYLLLSLRNETSEPQTLVIHLKMRGVLRVEPAEQLEQPYLCARLQFEDGRELRFHDMWRWGGFWLSSGNEPDRDVTIPGLRDLGVEPLSPEFTPEIFHQRLTCKRGKLKPALLNQRIVAGIGNIYADESLHRAKLHPERRTETLSDSETLRLHNALVTVLTFAVEQGGHYARQSAKQNVALEDFSVVYRPEVYDGAGKPCPVCTKTLIKFQLQGRGTTYCPNCQPSASAPTEVNSVKSARTERSVSAYV